jgi:PKD repeat protein
VNVTNTPPIAVADADVVSGEAPLTVNFFGSSSTDADGSISSAGWTFGDGSSAGSLDTSHTYTSAGSYTATLTVTDNLGDTDTASIAIEISAPPFVDSYVAGEEPSAGTLGGSVSNLQANDGAVRSVTERESGGRKSNRHSYLEHTWVIDVPGGDSAMLYLGGYVSQSNDGDVMLLSYSMNGGSFQPLGITLSSSDNDYMAALPTDGGQLRVRVVDSDQTAGNRSLDTVYIDQLYVRTENGSGTGGGGGGDVTATAPAPAIVVGATALSSDEVRVTWTDQSDDEQGFRVERSEDGVSWETAGTAGVNSELLDDTGVSPATTYYYQVTAFNSAGDSAPSNTVSVTTPASASISLQGSGSKRKGVKTVNLSWTGLSGGNVYRDSALAGTASGNSFSETLGKGGGTYVYQVCEGALGGNCSNPLTIVF